MLEDNNYESALSLLEEFREEVNGDYAHEIYSNHMKYLIKEKEFDKSVYNLATIQRRFGDAISWTFWILEYHRAEALEYIIELVPLTLNPTLYQYFFQFVTLHKYKPLFTALKKFGPNLLEFKKILSELPVPFVEEIPEFEIIEEYYKKDPFHIDCLHYLYYHFKEYEKCFYLMLGSNNRKIFNLLLNNLVDIDILPYLKKLLEIHPINSAEYIAMNLGNKFKVYIYIYNIYIYI